MRSAILSFAFGLFLLSGALATGAREKGVAPIHISHGQEVNLADYLVPGKITVFDFYSEFCPDCKALEPHLDRLHRDRPDLAVVKVDINRPEIRGQIDWDSPVAHQYQIKYTPRLMVYGPDGRLQADGKAAKKLVASWFR